MTANASASARHARAAGRSRQIVLPLAGGLAAVIGIVSLVCLLRLHSAGLSRWCGLLSAPITVCSFLVMTAVANWREHPGRHVWQAWTVLVMFAVLLLSVIRILLPASLDDGRRAVWVQPLIVAAGIAFLFLSMNVIAGLPNPGDWLRKRPNVPGPVFLGAIVLVVCAVAYLALPGRTAVLPARPRPADSLVVPLAVALIALFAVFVTRPRWAVNGVPGLRMNGAGGFSGTALDLIASPTPEATALLLAVAVVGFFALTRDLGTGVALLCASIAVFVSGSRSLVTVSAETGAAQRPRPLRLVAFSLVTFVAGASLVIAFGWKALDIPQFSFDDALGYSDRQPLPFFSGNDLLTGPGHDDRFDQLWRGTSGSAPDVLAAIGHEAGVLCLIGLIIVFALLFLWLGRLTIQITNRTGNAMAWGLIVLLAIQCLLAVETLFPVGVPIGEGPPLLSGGWTDYFADLIAIGVVIGLTRRAPSAVARNRASTETPPSASTPYPA